MAAPRRKKAAKAPAKATKPKAARAKPAAAKPAGKAKPGLLASLAQYVATKAKGLVRRTKKRTKRRTKKAKPA